MKYKVLLFDADDTLFDFKKAEAVALKNAMEAFHFFYEEPFHLQKYITVNTAIWKEFEEGKISQSVLKVERFRRYFAAINRPGSPEEFAKTFMEKLANASILLDGAEALIKQLKELGYKIIIVTNGLTDVQETRIGKSILAPYLDGLIISESVGVSKPSVEIFDLALKPHATIEKDEILMIGDSLSTDIRGGVNYGIDTCWYNPSGLKNNSNLTPTYTVEHFNGLLTLLG